MATITACSTPNVGETWKYAPCFPHTYLRTWSIIVSRFPLSFIYDFDTLNILLASLLIKEVQITNICQRQWPLTVRGDKDALATFPVTCEPLKSSVVGS